MNSMKAVAVFVLFFWGGGGGGGGGSAGANYLLVNAASKIFSCI